MKKILLIFVSILLVVALAACAGDGSANSDNNSDITKNDGADINSESSNSDFSGEDTGKKILVVYYSATGSTKKAAEYIALATGADTFELVPKQPYSSSDLNWNDENSRVVHEHDNPEDRNVELENTTVDNFSEYDTVFIGYPLWWGIAAWPVDSFIKANDFTSKTVISFCTSASSGFGNSGKLLEEAAGTGNWTQGKRFSSGVSENEIEEWVNSLKLQ